MLRWKQRRKLHGPKQGMLAATRLENIGAYSPSSASRGSKAPLTPGIQPISDSSNVREYISVFFLSHQICENLSW